MPLLFVTAFIVGFSGAMMPGPLLTVAITEAMKGGYRSVLLVVGHAAAELVLIAGLFLGLQLVLGNGIVKAAIGILGGGFLAWMSYGILSGVARDEVSLDLEAGDADGTGSVSRFGPTWTGAVVSASNPYWMLWWATVGLVFLKKGLALGLVGAGVFFVGHILADFAWYGMVVVLVVTGRRWITQGVYRGVLAACGAVLLVLALRFVFEGIALLDSVV